MIFKKQMKWTHVCYDRRKTIFLANRTHEDLFFIEPWNVNKPIQNNEEAV